MQNAYIQCTKRNTLLIILHILKIFKFKLPWFMFILFVLKYLKYKRTCDLRMILKGIFAFFKWKVDCVYKLKMLTKQAHYFLFIGFIF